MARESGGIGVLKNLALLLTDEGQIALLDNTEEFRAFVTDLVTRTKENVFFTPCFDEEAVRALVEFGEYDEPNASHTVYGWRTLAGRLGYTGPVVWKVRKGFTLKKHASKVGCCYDDLRSLRGWNLRNNKPTIFGLAFFIPRLVEGSENTNVEKQLALLSDLREQICLPEHHLTSFGSANLLAGLILAYFEHAIGVAHPFRDRWVRTDTLISRMRTDTLISRNGSRLVLGVPDDKGLACDYWSAQHDSRGISHLGCFPVGVEIPRR